MPAAIAPFTQFFDLDGKPLDGGTVWLGRPNENPETAAIPVYWDADGTLPAAQPIRTMNGYTVRNGRPAAIHTDAEYSLVVKNRRGELVLNERAAYAPASAVSFLKFIASLLSSVGTSLIGFLQTGTGAVRRVLQDRLRDQFYTTDFGVVGNWDGFTGTNDTVAVQTFFTRCEQLTKAGFIPRRYMLVDPISMGDPATANDFSASGQAPGFFSVQGECRLLTTFYASAACTGKTVLTRQNLSGMTIRGFGVDGRGLADIGIDLGWIYKNNIAPSSQNIIEDLQAGDCRVIGINLDGMHDSKIAGIRTYGSPIGVSLCGGGGQLSLSNSAVSGLLRISGQNIEISQSVALSGLDINGNTDNRILLSGTQVFPIASVPQIASTKWGYGIATQDSGTYGAHLQIDAGLIFGGATGCLVGNFASFRAENTLFDWAGGNFFGLITTGNAQPPCFEFVDCEFRGLFSTGPTMVLPTIGHVILRRCFVSGVYYEYLNTAEEFAIVPKLVSGGNLDGTGNTYSRQIGRVRICGNVVHTFVSLFLDTVGPGHSGIMFISGLVGTPSEHAVGAAAISITSLMPFPVAAGPVPCTQLGIQMQPSSDKAAIFGFGNGTGPTPTNAAGYVPGTGIEAVITTRRT